jgi:hypothetical protein
MTASTYAHAAIDPAALHAAVIRELRNGTPDEDGAVLFGDGALLADPTAGEVWEGDGTRSADQELRLGLTHLAAALAAGATLDAAACPCSRGAAHLLSV